MSLLVPSKLLVAVDVVCPCCSSKGDVKVLRYEGQFSPDNVFRWVAFCRCDRHLVDLVEMSVFVCGFEWVIPV